MNTIENKEEELFEDNMDKYYSDFSDMHYILKMKCDEDNNGLLYHSNDYSFIELLREHIIFKNNVSQDSESDNDELLEISDI